jgi:hypothetical protein
MSAPSIASAAPRGQDIGKPQRIHHIVPREIPAPVPGPPDDWPALEPTMIPAEAEPAVAA